jgi:hypothetical protein
MKRISAPKIDRFGVHDSLLEWPSCPRGWLAPLDCRHFIGELVKKPQAFRRSFLRNELLPRTEFRVDKTDGSLVADTPVDCLTNRSHWGKGGPNRLGIGTALMIMLDRRDDIITTGITTVVVLVVAAMDARHAWL